MIGHGADDDGVEQSTELESDVIDFGKKGDNHEEAINHDEGFGPDVLVYDAVSVLIKKLKS